MKKRALKKMIGFFLVLLLAASFLPVCVLAADTGRDLRFFQYSDVWINLKFEQYASQDIIIPKEYQAAQKEWISSDESTAAVDQNGEVTLYKPGYAEITARLQNGDYGLYRIHIYQIVVAEPVITMKVDETTQNEVQLIAEEPRDMDLVLAYSSDQEGVVTVDQSGALHAVAEGTALITVRVSGSQMGETFTVEVTDPEKVLPENDGGAPGTPPADSDKPGTGTDTEATAPGDADGEQTVTTPESLAETTAEPINTTKKAPVKTTTILKTVKTTSKTTPAAEQSNKATSSTVKSTPTKSKKTTATSSGNAVKKPQASADHSTAAVPAAVINEPQTPTVAYVNPAGGNNLVPDSDNMASHAGAVAGMLAIVAAGGAVGTVKAYKLKKYEADV